MKKRGASVSYMYTDHTLFLIYILVFKLYWSMHLQLGALFLCQLIYIFLYKITARVAGNVALKTVLFTVPGLLCGFMQGISKFFVLWQAQCCTTTQMPVMSQPQDNVFLSTEDGLKVLRQLLRQLIWDRCTISLWSSALELALQNSPLENRT